jgi:hypothetical protein
MTEFQVSAALLRTLPRLMARANPERDSVFESGQATRPVTRAYLRQAAHGVASRVVTKASKQRPTTQERQKDIERRRKWAGGGNMPPEVRACYSEAERAALSVIGEECKHNGFCSLYLEDIARLAGVSRTSVQNAVRKARSNANGHISVRERPQKRGKSLTNVIKVISQSWLGWIARATGFKRLNTSETAVKITLSEQGQNSKWAFESEGLAAIVGKPATLPLRPTMVGQLTPPPRGSFPRPAGLTGRDDPGLPLVRHLQKLT